MFKDLRMEIMKLISCLRICVRCLYEWSGLFKVAVPVRVRDKLMLFSPGALRCSCEAFKVFDFYDAKTCFPDDLYLLDHCSGYQLAIDN